MIRGFYLKLDPCTTVKAELSAIHHGLSMALSVGDLNLVVESDCVQAISPLVDGAPTSHDLALMVDNIKALIPSSSQVRWHLVSEPDGERHS